VSIASKFVSIDSAVGPSFGGQRRFYLRHSTIAHSHAQSATVSHVGNLGHPPKLRSSSEPHCQGLWLSVSVEERGELRC